MYMYACSMDVCMYVCMYVSTYIDIRTHTLTYTHVGVFMCYLPIPCNAELKSPIAMIGKWW